MEFSHSLKNNFEFRRLYSKGVSFATPLLVIYYKKNNTTMNRLGITVGKKIGCAVYRNKVRRKIKEIYRLNEYKLIQGYDMVFVARAKSRDASYMNMEKDFLYLVKKSNLLRNTNEKDTGRDS